MSLEAHRPARFRDRARARARPGRRLHACSPAKPARASRSWSMPCSWRWARAPTPAWCAKAPPAPTSAPNSTCRPALAPWLEEAGFEADDSLLLRRSIDSQGKSRAWINGSPATATQLREAGRPAGRHPRPARLAKPDPARSRARPARRLRRREHRRRCSSCGSAGARRRRRWRTRAPRRTRCSANASAWPGRSAKSTSWRPARTSGTSSTPATRACPTRSRCSKPRRARCRRWRAKTAAPPAACRRRRRLLQGQEHVEPAFRELARGAGLQPGAGRGRGAFAARLPAQDRPGSAAPGRTGRAHVAVDVAVAPLQAHAGGAAGAAGRRGRRSWPSSTRRPTWPRWKPPKRRTATPTWPKPARCPRPAPRPRRSWPRPSRRPCRAWACRAAASKWRCRPLEQPTQGGLEEISFLVAGHAGSTPRPVGKVASGGELSRIALAIAVTTSRLGTAQTLIFDEVDSGVGGAVAETVGRLMKQLGRDRQVLAVTHLPQVAACADHHLVVAKQQRRRRRLPAPCRAGAGRAARGRSRAHAGRRAPVAAPRWRTPRKCCRAPRRAAPVKP